MARTQGPAAGPNRRPSGATPSTVEGPFHIPNAPEIANGENVTEAGPSRPVQVLGLTSVPGAGDSFLVAQDERTARQIAEKREAAKRAASLSKARKRISLEDLNKHVADGKIETLNLILKGDAAGAVEALEESLLGIDVGEGVDLLAAATAYLGLPLFLALWLGHKLVTGSKPVRAEDADLTRERW